MPTRRAFLASGLAAASPAADPPRYRNFFGDLHNHNVIGYAQGSLERSFDIARNHLDFFAFTPHSHWHDIKSYENNIEDKWLNGFAVVRDRWKEVLAAARKYEVPGRFVTMTGYEWHSTSVGDYHVVFPDLDAELTHYNDVRELQAFVKRRRAIMIPHHPSNRRGHRGADPSKWDRQASPVLEMFSEWGNAEHDRAPFPYARHTEGGRWTRNTMQYFLAQGHRFGIVASTDDHLGYPGGYRQGLAVVKAPELSRAAVMDALRERRCYAVSGDRIYLDFTLNGHTMGREIPYAREREIRVEVRGRDQVDRVEVLKNNRVIHRDFPMDRQPGPQSWNKPLLVRFEYGWGPWPVLGMGRTADWLFEARVDGGRLKGYQTCFLPGPLEESRRDRILSSDERRLKVQSFTALRQQVDDVSQKAVVLEIEGTPETKLTIACEQPSRAAVTQTLRELVESGEALFTGEFPKESALLHRAVFADHYETAFTTRDTGDGRAADFYYVRVVQANGQHAWSSPIWVERI